MSSPKNRDLAKELVDFLLNEQKKDKPGEGGDKKPKLPSMPAVAPPGAPKAEPLKSEDQKTFALETVSQLPKLKPLPAIPSGGGVVPKYDESEPGVVGGHEQGPAVSPPVEFDLNLGEGPVEIDFSERSQIVKNLTENADIRAHKNDLKTSSFHQDEVSTKAENTNQQNKVFKFGDTANHPPPFASARGTTIFKEVSTLVGGAEAIRVAQARIVALEKERDQLRDETEKLLSATEGFQRRIAEMKALQETTDRKHRERVEILEEEKIVMKGRLSAREGELADVRKQFEELQVRFQNDLRKIRVRERELENRQELLKAESATLIRSKDEMILEMKRQLDQLQYEIDNFRAKSSDMDSKINEFQDRNHRTVKALRLALSVLEGSDFEEKIKKVSGQ